MRDSFIFHAEYVELLPQKYKEIFTMYAINYGIYGTEPELEKESLEWTVWQFIKPRITSDCEKRDAKIKAGKAHKGNQWKVKKTNQNKPGKTAFIKPTVEEIAAYCKERNNKIDVQAFFDFYESKGWKIGAVNMKDWKASIRTWEKRERGEKQKSGVMWGKENDIPEELLNNL